ncbi:MAG: hypothetical protein QXH27_00860 [Candidatus Micrarchaeia archaeon]
MGVVVRTGSRLHFGLFDLNGERGRCDGGAGVYLEKPGVEVEAEESKRTEVIAEERVAEILAAARAFAPHRIIVRRSIPPHVGLGSTTQLLLAVAKACAPHRRAPELARVVGRGGTSGIGTWGFAKGGLIFDAGHAFPSEKKSFLPSAASRAPPPPLLARIPLPRNWLFVCSVPSPKRIHGKLEKKIFARYCPIPSREVERAFAAAFSQIAPGALERDISLFGEGIVALQSIGFKKIEWRFQEKATREAFTLLQKECAGAGLSSFGPLVFGVTDSAKQARGLASFLPNAFVSRVRNKGASIAHFSSSPA